MITIYSSFHIVVIRNLGGIRFGDEVPIHRSPCYQPTIVILFISRWRDLASLAALLHHALQRFEDLGPSVNIEALDEGYIEFSTAAPVSRVEITVGRNIS